jgi:hypothetical protein
MIQKVFITKYALTSGIIVADMDVREDAGYCWGKPPGYRYATGFSGKDFHLTKEEALQDCENRRIKKIATLKKQIVNLENLKFKL